MLAKANQNEIWSLLQSGNQQALLALYNKHYLGLINYGIKLTGNRELTNDCITQILLRLWDKRDKLSPVENVRSYLLTCLRRELMTELKLQHTRLTRNKDWQRTFEEAELSYEEYIIQLQSNKALKEKLAKAMEKLTEREKELLKLRFFEDLDYDEIATTCNITRRTAYNIIYTALKTLKAEFTQYPNYSMVYNQAMMALVLLSVCS